jgi:hypothetical protein
LFTDGTIGRPLRGRGAPNPKHHNTLTVSMQASSALV